MASNRKEEIRVEWQINKNSAIQQLNEVKQAVSDNAYEVDKLNQAQYRLEAEYKKFEKTLDSVGDELGENEVANNDLAKAIEKLEQRINNVDTAIVEYKSHLEEVTKANNTLDKAIDKVASSVDDAKKSIDKASASNKKLADSSKEVETTTKASASELVASAGIWEHLDSVTMGLSSKFRDFIGVQGGLKGALTATSREFTTLNTLQKATVVTTNAVKLAMKTLLTATGIGLLVVAVGSIAEHWDSIVDSVKGFVSESYKANSALIESNNLEVEKLSKIDNQTEQMKLQGMTDAQINKKKLEAYEQILKKEKETLQAIKEKDKQNVKWTTNIKVKFMEAVSWVVKGLGFLMKAITTPTEVFLGMLEKGINSLIDSSVGKFLGLSGKVDLTFVHGNIDKVMNDVDAYVKKKTSEWRNADYEESDEYKQQLSKVESMEEKRAGQINKINDSKKGGTKASSSKDDIKKAEEELKAWQNAIASLLNDTNILLNSDNPIEKRLSEIKKAEDDYISEQSKKYEELAKNRKKGTPEYEKDKAIIDDYYNNLFDKLNTEKVTITNNTKAFEELSKKINDGSMTAKEMKKEIDKFLKGVENSEMRDEWSKLLGLEQIENAISLIGELKDEIKDYEIDTTESFSKNKENLAKTLADNIVLIEKERDEKLKQLGDDEKFANERKQIQADADNAITEQQEAHSKAGKELNKIRGEQIRDMASATIDGLANLNNALGENFEISKMLSAGSAIINTWEGVTNNLAQYPQPVAGIMAGVTIASGLASVISILKTTPESAGSNLPTPANLEGAKNMPNVQFMQSETSQLQNTINQQNNQDNTVKAYVVGKDVTSQAEKDSIKKKNSSL
ncbi:rhoptry family protein [Paenimyroides baculatum]|uniref:Uncharacterized protein n=1 Tax=Paenimyroides baculatum TaxID=2608000 RepID=A0A5M6CH63_9FLAO|nr:hypothetical protein [Paenimyroides baculatum]KAA5534303.1 hypothetical protein F0460_09350 [Paenimyroides baculatum]